MQILALFINIVDALVLTHLRVARTRVRSSQRASSLPWHSWSPNAPCGFKDKMIPQVNILSKADHPVKVPSLALGSNLNALQLY